MSEDTQKAYFAAGCFWGPEDKFAKREGVVATRVGYSGGDTENPTYEQVCGGDTGHAETTEVTFDPSRVSYAELVEFFFDIHDPTTLNRQGVDVGTQYRSVVFYLNEEQRQTAEQIKEEREASRDLEGKIVTEVAPFEAFYPAEEYHQKFLEKKRGV